MKRLGWFVGHAQLILGSDVTRDFLLLTRQRLRQVLDFIIHLKNRRAKLRPVDNQHARFSGAFLRIIYRYQSTKCSTNN